jgi:transcriptional antiterminator RfaH
MSKLAGTFPQGNRMCAFRVDRNLSYSQTHLEGLVPTRPWFALFTHPRHEKRVAEHLRLRDVEAYLPTYTCRHIWKNRQTVTLEVPLFPGYMFARIAPTDRVCVLGVPGVVTIVEGARESGHVPDHYVEFLRTGLALGRIHPQVEPVIGDRVRILHEPFAGLEGILACERAELRVAVAIECIGQSISIEVSRTDIEWIATPGHGASRLRGLYQ